jgi:hypothetical protein
MKVEGERRSSSRNNARKAVSPGSIEARSKAREYQLSMTYSNGDKISKIRKCQVNDARGAGP